MVTKGAVEEMLQVCAFAEYKNVVEPLTEEVKQEILETVKGLNENGMRVLAIAQKNNPSAAGTCSVQDESDMVLMGYLAFLDPPKETTKAAIEALKTYGVSTKILTGDNDAVTRCICRQVGLKVDNLLLGSDIELLTDSQLAQVVETTNVFAKLSPEQKTRIVHALRENGHTPSEAFNETVEELTQSLMPLFAKNGMDWMYANCSTTAQRGALDWMTPFHDAIKPVVQKLYASVKSGNEAQISIDSNSQPDYREKLNEELRQLRESEMWQTAVTVRQLRPENN